LLVADEKKALLKVAIVGCGKIADSHVAQIQRISNSRIVGVCDREELMAKQLFERSRVGQYFNSLSELLAQTDPDVVHITTPPQSHFELARQCLEYGCHVYVEKPFTVNTSEAELLVELAQEKQLKVTVGHDDQFRHAARKMRRLIADGYLGGPPVHMESYYCYDLGSPNGYVGALLGDKEHWVRQLPGGLLHNIISHGIARMAEFLNTDRPQVIAQGFVSPFLRGLEEDKIIDELRVIIIEERRLTGYFTFSSQMRPSLHQFRIYGPKNGLSLDQDSETLLRLRGTRYKSYLDQFAPPLTFAWQYLGNSLANMRAFLANDFHPKSGMKHLIESFYCAITDDAPLPIPYREILVTSRIMDDVFSQVAISQSDRQAGLPERTLADPILP
jgi:predicted dehydrogenase